MLYFDGYIKGKIVMDKKFTKARTTTLFAELKDNGLYVKMRF